jgi:hypothetical protein
VDMVDDVAEHTGASGEGLSKTGDVEKGGHGATVPVRGALGMRHPAATGA